jgi:MoxR-like ATPase
MSDSSLFHIIGREKELDKIKACVLANRNVLLEGPVGVGKTHLALAVTHGLKRQVFRVDGDNRYSEQKLSGWFDPPTVITKGFSWDSFFPGPLVEAMKSGGVLFINELNRLPEGVQNVLLPAIDERMIIIPRLGEVFAAPGFIVIATQNPKEFVATSHLSEAILDRFELVGVNYQDEPEELGIILHRLQALPIGGVKNNEKLISIAAVKIVRMTRRHPRIRRGASVRAAMSIAEIVVVLMNDGKTLEQAFLSAALMALPTRIELEREVEIEGATHIEVEDLLRGWAEEVLREIQEGDLKKKH